MKKVMLFLMLVFLPTAAFAANVDGRQTVTTGGTAVALGTGRFNKIDVCAETDNTGIITIGYAPIASLSTRAGIPLNAGDCWHYEPKDSLGNLALIKIDTTVNTDGVTYTTYD